MLLASLAIGVLVFTPMPLEAPVAPALRPACTSTDSNVAVHEGDVDGRTSRIGHCPKPKKVPPTGGDPPATRPKQPSKPPQIRIIGPHCSADIQICDPTPPETKKKPTKGPDASASLREVVAKLKLPDPSPRFGPDPSVNEWNMLVVGYPIWLWTDRPTQLTTTAHHDGLTFHLTATWTSTTFNMGDTHTKTCTTTTVYPAYLDKPGRPSPTCGYIYDTRSPKNHPYTVTAQTNWQINWTTAGQTGTLNTTYTGTRTLEIGELQSLVNG